MLLLEVFSSQAVYRLTLAVLVALVLLTLTSQFGQFLYLELTTHFRLQYVLASLVCAVALTAFQSWKFLPIALLCAALNAAYLLPYLSAPPTSRSGEPHFRVLHANVLKDNTDYQAVLGFVDRSDADVVVLQEVTDTWGEQIKSLAVKYPYFVIEPRAQGAGMAVFSRYPFNDIQPLKLDDSTHLAILAKVSLSGRSLSVLAMHPTTPITGTKFKNRNRQFREASALLKSLEGPKVLIGDLNTTMWSPYFAGLLHDSGLRDARMGLGLKTSWPMPLPAFLRLPIDHCLVSRDIQVERFEIGSRTGSDHLPIIIDLSLQ
jgi:endonuclease/exonuclease/phosphatase (EEP) superfamily protein YafD